MINERSPHRPLGDLTIGLVRLAGLALLGASAGCLSDQSPGGEVGSETHFLSVCSVNNDCADGLACYCGICTTPCETTCATGTCADPESAAVLSYCGVPAPRALCLAACTTGVDCDSGRCEDGACVAGPRPEGAHCATASECEGGLCTLGYCGPSCDAGDETCPENTLCRVPGDFAGVCVPGVLEAFPSAVDHGNIDIGGVVTVEVTVRNTSPREQTLVAIQVEALTATAPSEVAVAQTTPLTLPAGERVTLTLSMAPSGAGPRSYRVAFRVSEADAPPLVVNVTFVGVSPTGP